VRKPSRIISQGDPVKFMSRNVKIGFDILVSCVGASRIISQGDSSVYSSLGQECQNWFQCLGFVCGSLPESFPGGPDST
jgi:hypothetical protein